MRIFIVHIYEAVLLGEKKRAGDTAPGKSENSRDTNEVANSDIFFDMQIISDELNVTY